MLIGVKWSVSGHEVMESRSGDERSDESDEIVVHVSRVTKSGRRSGHDARDELIDLGEGRIFDVQALADDSIQGGIIQNHDAVRVLSQAFQSEDGVVGLNDNVGYFVLSKKAR